MTRRLLPPIALLPIVFALAAGCAQKRDGDLDLALYCQVKNCICKPAVLRFGENLQPVPLLWRTNGDAYCPPDYKLTPTAKINSFKRHYGG